MKRLFLFFLLAASSVAQTINPSQIRPSSTPNDVMTTVGGVSTWHAAPTAPISGQTAGCIPLAGSISSLTATAHICENTPSGVETVTQPVTISDGTGKAGMVGIQQGTAQSTTANSVGITAPSSVTAYNFTLPGAQGAGAFTNDGTGVGSWTPLNPSACSANSTADICITAAPYYASVEGATTTTISGSLTSGSTSGTVGSCSTFLAHEGILITGAGTAGGNFIDHVVSCTGTTLTWSTGTVTTVSGPTVQHDETAAFNTAVAAIAALSPRQGTIWLPCTNASGGYASFLVNGPLQDTGGANAIIPMPVIANYSGPMANITFAGMCNVQPVGLLAGPVITTAANTGNLFGGYDAATGGGYPPFTNVHLTMRNLWLVGPTNPGIVMVNATNLMTFQGYHLGCMSQAGTLPSNTAGACFEMPKIDNNVELSLEDVAVDGFYTGYLLTEHTVGRSIYAQNGVNCFVIDNNGTNGTYHGDSVTVSNLWGLGCTNGIVGGTHQTAVSIQAADFEHTGTYQISDPSNSLHGFIDINIPQNGVGAGSMCAAALNGGANLQLRYMSCAPAVPQNLTSSLTWTGCTVTGNVCVVGTPGATVTVSGIPGNYTDLLIRENARVSDSADHESVTMQLNGDTGSNYGGEQLFAAANTATAGASQIASTSVTVCIAPGSTAVANLATGCTLKIYSYAGTTFAKNFWGASSSFGATGANTAWYNYDVKGMWTATPAAVTSVTLTDGGGGNFAAGSSFTVTGEP